MMSELGDPAIVEEPFPTDPVSAYQRYSQCLQLIMLDFQFIEEALRMYLAAAYSIIKYRMSDVLPFKLSYETIENDALGRLVRKFGQLSNDKALVAQLQQITPFRNQCAHRGLLLTSDEQKDVAYLAKETANISTNRLKARECFKQISQEVERLDKILRAGGRS